MLASITLSPPFNNARTRPHLGFRFTSILHHVAESWGLSKWGHWEYRRTISLARHLQSTAKQPNPSHEDYTRSFQVVLSLEACRPYRDGSSGILWNHIECLARMPHPGPGVSRRSEQHQATWGYFRGAVWSVGRVWSRGGRQETNQIWTGPGNHWLATERLWAISRVWNGCELAQRSLQQYCGKLENWKTALIVPGGGSLSSRCRAKTPPSCWW